MISIFLCLALAMSLAGVFLTIKEKAIVGGAFKALSTCVFSIIGIYNFMNPLVTVAFLIVIFGDIVLSFLNPLLKKEYFFMMGLGSFMIAYALFAIHFFMIAFNLKVFIVLLTFAICSVIYQISKMNKANSFMKIILYVYVSVLSLFLISSAFMSVPMFLGVCFIYASDSVIGHSSFNGKYPLKSVYTELLITITFTIGLFLFV